MARLVLLVCIKLNFLSFCSEEEKCILVKVTAPCNSSITESDNLTLASCTVKYFDVINSRPVQHRVECTIVLNPNITSPVTSDCVDDIEQHRLRCEVAESLGEANKMADRGNFEGARGLLKKAAIRVKGSRVCRQLLAQHLLETLQESLEGIQDKVTYVQHGKSELCCITLATTFQHHTLSGWLCKTEERAIPYGTSACSEASSYYYCCC